jgi:hypothetical protein
MIPLPLTYGIVLGRSATKTREAALLKDSRTVQVFRELGHFPSGLAKYVFGTNWLWDLIGGQIGQVAKSAPG